MKVDFHVVVEVHAWLRSGAHEGYISWDIFEANVKHLRENSGARAKERTKGPAREGPALLQGIAMCGLCGDRMTVRYHLRGSRRVPDYACQRKQIERAEPPCQIIHGAGLDDAIGALLVETVTPMTLEVALKVQEEIEVRAIDADGLRRQEVERARYEAELARRRYMQVDPSNRLVADSLEAEWNGKLRLLEDAQNRCEAARKATPVKLDDSQRADPRSRHRLPALVARPTHTGSGEEADGAAASF